MGPAANCALSWWPLSKPQAIFPVFRQPGSPQAPRIINELTLHSSFSKWYSYKLASCLGSPDFPLACSFHYVQCGGMGHELKRPSSGFQTLFHYPQWWPLLSVSLCQVFLCTCISALIDGFVFCYWIEKQSLKHLLLCLVNFVMHWAASDLNTEQKHYSVYLHILDA